MSATEPVPGLDLDRLGAWLEAHAAGFRGLHSAQRLAGGNSNPIWRLDAASGRYILRTQPAGALLKSAHALDREARVLTALQGTAVPVPRLHLLCNDPSVLGVQFYLMDFLEGEVHRAVSLKEVPPAQRAAVYRSALDVLVRIHRTDLVATGLHDFGRAGNYFQRQLHRWTQQYRTAIPEGDAEIDRLIERLEAMLPEDDLSPVLLHGDSRIDNLMFARGGTQVIAVLDWELSTLGHPLADLGQFLGVQELPSEYLLPGLAGVDRQTLGIPSQRELARHYLEAMGLDAARDLRFFKAFALFRQAAMSAGLLRRAREGTAISSSALAFGQTAAVFARTGLQVLATPTD